LLSLYLNYTKNVVILTYEKVNNKNMILLTVWLARNIHLFSGKSNYINLLCQI